MMTIDIYSTNSRADALTKNLTVVKSNVTINNKQSIDILNPDFIVDYDATLINANYVYCADMGRYYFYRKPPAILTGGRMIIFCAVDVLATYADAIKSCKGIVLRQSTPTNFKDDKYPLLPDYWITSVKFNSPFTNLGTLTYVVGINSTYS